MRDEVRALAEVAGATSMTGLINSVFSQVLESLTSLAKYDECFTPNTVLAIAANGVVSLPLDLQHIDLTEIYFSIDGIVDERNVYRLHPYTRMRSKYTGHASQYRLYGLSQGGGQVRRMEITPFDEIDTVNDRIRINYWKKLTWANDITTFPIMKLREVTILKTAARVAKQTNSRLSNRLTNQARDAYIAMRASSLIS